MEAPPALVAAGVVSSADLLRLLGAVVVSVDLLRRVRALLVKSRAWCPVVVMVGWLEKRSGDGRALLAQEQDGEWYLVDVTSVVGLQGKRPWECRLCFVSMDLLSFVPYMCTCVTSSNCRPFFFIFFFIFFCPKGTVPRLSCCATG